MPFSTAATSDLQTVSVVCFSKNEKTKCWIDALENNGINMLQDGIVQTLQDIARQKLAVILDQDTPEEKVEDIIQKYEALCDKDPLMSLRFFYLKWDREISNRNDRLRIIDLMDIAPNELPARFNRALFKARLPVFLRTHYDIEISDTLEEIDGVQYRPIILRSYKKEGEKKVLEYATENLYIHNKCLYSFTSTTQKMTEIKENMRVFVQKYGSNIPAQLVELILLKNETEEE